MASHGRQGVVALDSQAQEFVAQHGSKLTEIPTCKDDLQVHQVFSVSKSHRCAKRICDSLLICRSKKRHDKPCLTDLDVKHDSRFGVKLISRVTPLNEAAFTKLTA